MILIKKDYLCSMNLDDIINDRNSDARELKRALVVKMDESGMARKEICKLLNVLDTYISRWCIHYESNNKEASSLLLIYKGSSSYLMKSEKLSVVEYLNSQTTITLLEFKNYLLSTYKVRYKSDQSYYDLLKLGNLSWKKTQKKTLEKMKDK
jgi:transposase